ncbi:unnamed protein product [Mytilus coruscus]|uniref:C2H2-type domain-containing protein n=1 Tax=Mytilus coruscus TaxID=42192 RepID=A0A6J8BG46_MYTCO|nr:unnamed protein product [Mytilus coruscus]
MLQPYTETELRDAQKNDIDLSTIITWLSTDFSPTKQDLQMSSPFKILYRRHCIKLDTARKVGISPKLKAPWKGPYVVVEAKSPVLLKMKDRGREEVVHHDRLKLCIDREIPLWRLRNDILGKVENKMEQNINMDLEDLYLDILFNNENQNDLNSLSESLTIGFHNDNPFFVSDYLATDSNNERIILKDLHSLVDVPQNLDTTFVYDLSQNVLLPSHDDKSLYTLDNGSRREQTGRRKRQMPSYLQDYLQKISEVFMVDEHDYGQFDGEILDRLEKDTKIKGSSRNLSKARLCPVCPGRFTNVRRHVYHKHLPWYTNALTACWTCHKQFGQRKMLENHCLELHNCNIVDNTFKDE